MIGCFPIKGQAQNCNVVLNHFLVVVDSITYQAILGSEILNSDFAYGYEKNKNFQGIYIIGQNNYIEIFHPQSIPNESLPIGLTWICQASLKANCLEKYVLPNIKKIEYSSDEDYDYLSVYTKDTANIMTTWEMNKNQYESWTKKTFNDSVRFQTNDYNSPVESDSSNNYLFKNVTGFQLTLNSRDSLIITQYLSIIGYSIELNDQNSLKFSNSTDFIELNFSDNVALATVSVIYFKLNQTTEYKQISLGNFEIVIEGNSGLLKINKPSLSIPKTN